MPDEERLLDLKSKENCYKNQDTIASTAINQGKGLSYNNLEQGPQKKILATIKRKRLNPKIETLLSAYESKNLDTVLELLETGLDPNYREPARAHRTPVLYAVKFDFVEALEVLLKKGGDPTIKDTNGITALQISASHGCMEPLRRLIEYGVDLNEKDLQGRTALHFATRSTGEQNENVAFYITDMLLNAGASIFEKDNNGRTPLHSATVIGNTKVISLLLSGRGSALINARDKNGQTPLHLTVIGARSLLAVEKLLKKGAQIDARDKEGQTALHYVAARPINFVNKDFDGECLELLLYQGASVNIKNNKGYNPLSLALQRTMWWSRHTSRDEVLHSVQLLVSKGSAVIDSFDMWRIVETFPSLAIFALNQSIRANTSVKDSPHFKLILDYRPLTVNTRLLSERKGQTFVSFSSASHDESPIPAQLLSGGEMSMFHYICKTGHYDILRHSLCSTFLHLKWLRVRKFFAVTVIIYFLFITALTSYTVSCGTAAITLNEINSTNNATTSDSSLESKFGMKNITWTILFIFSVTLLIKEAIQIIHNLAIYVRHFENYIDLSVLVCVLVLLFLPDQSTLWQHVLSTIAIIISWFRLMFFLGQFPSCGVYVVMFSTVSVTVLKFLAMYIPLLLAFALGFLILLNDHDSFKRFPTAFVTTVIMMTGEIEYDDKIVSNKNLKSKDFACIILIVFLVFIYIILSNLLVALAVNDLSSIQQTSELIRLTRQAELLITVERFTRSPFLPGWLKHWIKNQTSVSHGYKEAMVVIYPNKKIGMVENMFKKLLHVFRYRKHLSKVFEFCFGDFIPPEPEPSLPEDLLKDAIRIGLTEIEIEKRDKLLLADYNQQQSFRNTIIEKKNEHIKFNKDFQLRKTARRDSLQNRLLKMDSVYDLDVVVNPRECLKPLKRQESFRSTLQLNVQNNLLEEEKNELSSDIKELKTQLASLQISLSNLTENRKSCLTTKTTSFLTDELSLNNRKSNLTTKTTSLPIDGNNYTRKRSQPTLSLPLTEFQSNPIESSSQNHYILEGEDIHTPNESTSTNRSARSLPLSHTEFDTIFEADSIDIENETIA